MGQQEAEKELFGTQEKAAAAAKPAEPAQAGSTPAASPRPETADASTKGQA